MSSDVAIQIENLSKCYHIYDKPLDRLLQMVFRGRRTYFREFWAVRDVSLTVEKGSTVAIVGRNGAGKSTLLQMICGTLHPTSGRIAVNGRVAALLELGAGFNTEFTGRENVYLSASLYGLSREQIDRRFDAIATFAGIGDYIEQPVKTYSSGMFVRLAFAVIAHVDADILIIDEALSVGDAFFQQKCMRFLHDFKARGGTLLFVSHDMGAVNALCESALLLRREGTQYLYQTGTPKEIAMVYLRDLYSEKAVAHSEAIAAGATAEGAMTSDAGPDVRQYRMDTVPPVRYHASTFRHDADSFGLGGATITAAFFRDSDGEVVSEFKSEDDVSLVIRASLRKEMTYPAIGFVLKDSQGQKLMAESTDSYLRDHAIVAPSGTEVEASFRMKFPALIRGEYPIDVAFAEGPGNDHVQHHLMHDVMVLTALGTNLVHGKFGAPFLSVSFDIN
ncbi:sugar ABC transporter ATP-binding protein [Burkholderia ubonensis]|uniref:ABC transporter ATP-binding protein n=1 Tax=Burkholderia ubonensis TaxID=101571 RepID=UPI00075F2E15|nr:ABC transporter ATP-binding protein [Burkholderia ubonensis]KVO80032.1 sugar ABC transporter ATP-binding protein [Burkholderia ubonensis]KVP04018.1 sugar ABC transporter ATP-binding protein [Burkholderia ubonensis]KVT71188.1 sugar ABC transporter ATP-binding protein [Burkholderia ubonensis]KVU62735.1 sugar ABC transporter ATP-binding protein [Burkholderia ubonensis]KVU70686.1 sugar ABC transporter ATP-binding protein [Burkholderia ubonensis]